MKINRIFFIFLLCFIGLSACDAKKNTKSSPFPEFRVTGNEEWNINENNYSIAETSIVILPNSKPFLTVKVLVDQAPGEHNNKEAKTIAKYAYANGYLDKANSIGLAKDGVRVKLSSNIGVTLLYQQDKGPISLNNGFNVLFKENELL